MAAYKAKVKSYTYAVYRQDPPVFVGREITGVEIFRAELVQVGQVSGGYNQCWEQAEKICPLPVMQLLSEEIVNVH